MSNNIVCVVPTIRAEQMESFRKAWAPLFKKHEVTLIVVWDGEEPEIRWMDFSPFIQEEGIEPKREFKSGGGSSHVLNFGVYKDNRDLFCRRTDAVRNVGFVIAANLKVDFILTLDDDVAPPAGSDPIQEHLDVLQRRVPISWMNTAIDYPAYLNNVGQEVRICTEDGPVPYLRGFPYGIRDEAPVMISHGVWVNVPDFDGRTQLELTENGTRPQDLPYSLPYFRGPVPKGCLMPICGMNLMVRKEALPYLYFAPMGPDSGYPDLHRFSDIWMGIALKRECDFKNWAIYTGASTVIHTRASDPFKNVEQEKLGIEWNERMWNYRSVRNDPDNMTDFEKYYESWCDKARRFQRLIQEIQAK